MAGRSVNKDKKTNTWYFVLTIGIKDNGKPKQIKRRGFKRKDDAIKAMNELEASINSGTYVETSKLLYKDYLHQWLEDKQTKVKPQTIKTYSWIVNKHIIPYLGNIELSKLNPMVIQQLYNRLTKEKSLSDENIQKVHTMINDSLKKAERWGYINKNHASLVDRPKATKKEVQVWTVDEVKRFLNHLEGNRYSIAFLLALTTGMRQGEILGLRWKDVDFENGCIRITQTLSADGKEILPYTKTKSGSRVIDLDDDTLSRLKKHRLQIRQEKLQAGAGIYKDMDLVICSEIGTPTNKSNLRRVYDRTIHKANVPKIRFHDMRHTHATLLLLQGENPKIVSERLGHADVRITLDTYSHLLPSMQKETAKKLGKLLFSDNIIEQSDAENVK